MLAISMYYILSFYKINVRRRLHGVSAKFRSILAETRRKIGQIGLRKRLRHPYRWRYENLVKTISIRNLIPKGVCFYKKIDLTPIKAVKREKLANFVNLLCVKQRTENPTDILPVMRASQKKVLFTKIVVIRMYYILS